MTHKFSVSLNEYDNSDSSESSESSESYESSEKKEEQEKTELSYWLDELENSDNFELTYDSESSEHYGDEELFEEATEEEFDDSPFYSSESLFAGFEDEDDDLYEETGKNIIPTVISEILLLLPVSACASYLRECGYSQQQLISQLTEEVLAGFTDDLKKKMFVIPNTSIAFVFFKKDEDSSVTEQRLQELRKSLQKEFEEQGGIIRKKGKTYTVLILYVSDDLHVSSVELREIILF